MQVTEDTRNTVAEIVWEEVFTIARPYADSSPEAQRECLRTVDRILEAIKITGETSDGYHTFNELYRYRMLYNAALFNAWVFAPDILRFDVHKSWRHSDGELPFPDEDGNSDWFIVMAELPTGQISNHYLAKDWDLFKIPERERAAEWDGHSPSDAAVRLEKFLRPSDEP